LLALFLLTLSFIVEIEDPASAFRRLLLIGLRAESALSVFIWSAPWLRNNPVLRPMAWLVFAHGCSSRDVVNGILLASCCWALSTFVREWMENEVDRRADAEFWLEGETEDHQPRLLFRWAQLTLTRRAFFVLRRMASGPEADALDSALANFIHSPERDVDALSLAVARISAHKGSTNASLAITQAITQRWADSSQALVAGFEGLVTRSACDTLDSVAPWPVRWLGEEPRTPFGLSYPALLFLTLHVAAFRVLEARTDNVKTWAAKNVSRAALVLFFVARMVLAQMRLSLARFSAEEDEYVHVDGPTADVDVT